MYNSAVARGDDNVVNIFDNVLEQAQKNLPEMMDVVWDGQDKISSMTAANQLELFNIQSIVNKRIPMAGINRLKFKFSS